MTQDPARPSPSVGTEPAAEHSAPRLVLRPRQYRPIATWALISTNVLIWLVMTAMGGSTRPGILVLFGAKVNSLIVQGQIWRLVTPIFLHIGIVHLAFNTYAIYVFGMQIERVFGTSRFLALYMLSGIVGVLASFSFSPNPSAGASSSIFGLIGTEAAFFYRYRKAFGRRGQQRLYNILIVIGYNLAFTFVASNIDVWGHLGGLAAGTLLSWWLMPRYKVVLTGMGPQLVDGTRPRQLATVLTVALACIVVSSAVAISLRAAQYQVAP